MSKRVVNVNKLDYTDLSKTHKCRICGKAIKQRLIEIKTVKPTLCYKHYISRTDSKITEQALANITRRNND